MRLDLLPEPAQRLPVEFLDPPAAQADDVCVFLLGPRLVVVLVTLDVHQVEFIDQLALLQHLQRAVDRHAVELRILLLGQLVKLLGV